jgi:preprotein translocase subunit SecD
MKTTLYKIVLTLLFVSTTAFAEPAGKELIEISAVSDAAAAGFSEMPYANGEQQLILHVSDSPIVTTKDVKNVSVSADPLVVAMQLSEEGSKKMMKGTKDLTGKRIAIIVNGVVRVAPVLQAAPLGGGFSISGFKNAAEAKALVDKFNKKEG